MTHISFHGQIVDLPAEASADWASAVIVGPLHIIGTLYWGHYFAMPGMGGTTYLRLVENAAQQLRENVSIVDDVRILQLINETLPRLEAIAAASQEISEWQKHHVPRKLITAHNKATRESGPREPAWHDQPDFKARLEKFSTEFSLYLDLLVRAIPIIRSILPPDTADPSNLLDRAWEQIPEIRTILKVGWAEAARMKAAELGYTPPA